MLFVPESQLNDFNAYVGKCWDQCPIVALFLAVATFEWVARRTLLDLANKPSRVVRGALGIPFDIEKYEEEWNASVNEAVDTYIQSAKITIGMRPLTWDAIKKSYKLAQALKLERSDGESADILRLGVDTLFAAVRAFNVLANTRGIDLNAVICK